MTSGVGDQPGALNCDTCYGQLTIGDVSMHTPAWCLLDLSELWSTPALRGSNRLIPGRQGRKPYRRRLDETQMSLPLLITGYCDSDGRAYSTIGLDLFQGLEANMAYLQNNVALPPDTADSTRVATLTLPSGNTRMSYVQVLGIRGGLSFQGIMTATLELVDTESKLIVGGEAVVDA